MKRHAILLLMIAMLSLADIAACTEVAYSFGPGGKTPVGQANITSYNGSDIVSFTVAESPGRSSATYKSRRSIDSIKEELNRAVDIGNQSVRDKGLELVGNRSGSRRIDQICSIYEYMADNWGYVDDWRGRELFQYSNYTLNEGKNAGKSGKGDCDDFAILMASLIESIGGTSRIVFAYGATGGHAYCEVYLGKEGDKNLERMLSWLKKEYRTDKIEVHSDPETDDVWLNMDWWKDSGGAKHPGGPFCKADTHIPLYIQDDIARTPLTPIENQLPIALFTYDPLQPLADGSVSFSAIASSDPDGNITNYEWDFGDGESARGALKSSCRHIYSIAGKFLVNLTVTDNEGDKSYKTAQVDVSEPLPEAKITYSPSYPKVGEAITFDSSQSRGERGNITSYEWDFGDGYFGKRDSIDHAYLKSGTYNVELIVTNDKGAKGSSRIPIFVDLKENATELADKGKAFFDQGKYDEAIQACEEAITINSTFSLPWYLKGLSFHAQGKYDEAIQAYDEAIRIDYKYAPAWNSKGRTLINQGKYDDAIQAYDKAIALNSTFSWPWFNKGFALDAQGKYREAIQAYNEGIKLDPNDAQAWNGKGLAFSHQGKYDDAILAYEKAIALNSTLTWPWFNKGLALATQGKYDEAIQSYDEAIRIDPKYSDAWNSKGLALQEQGKYDEAIRAYDEAIKLDPNNAQAVNSKGIALQAQGKYDEAIHAYDEAIVLNSTFSWPWFNKGLALQAQGKYKEAVQSYDEGINLDPNDVGAWNNKGNALGSQGKYEEAILAFDEAIRLDPNFAMAWNNKGKAFEALGKTDEANAAYAKAKELGYSS